MVCDTFPLLDRIILVVNCLIGRMLKLMKRRCSHDVILDEAMVTGAVGSARNSNLEYILVFTTTPLSTSDLEMLLTYNFN